MSTNFYPLKIKDVRRETQDSVSVGFEVPSDLKSIFSFKPGQHLTVRAALNGEDVRRNYSVCVGSHEANLRIAIKQVEGGAFSTWANTELRAGHTLEILPAMGRFTCEFGETSRRHYVGIAAGSGITPILSLLKSALAQEPASHFTLLYGNRCSNSIMFLEELAALKCRFLARLEVYHFLTEEEDEIELFNGRLDDDKYEQIFANLVSLDDVERYFICGPGAMMDAAERNLKAHGVDPQKILTERFTADRPTGAQAEIVAALAQKASGIRFTAILDGRRRAVAFDPQKQNMLDSAREAGLPAPFACKAGVCATCRARLVTGRVEMATNYGLSEAEVAQGYILTCQSVPLTDDVVVDYDG